MNIPFKSAIVAIAVPAFAAISPSIAQADEPPCEFNENRSGICGDYHSEVSPAEAYVTSVLGLGDWSSPSMRLKRPVILDVRSTSEYKAGHPERSYNVPFPYVYQYCNDVNGDDRRPDGACKSGGARIDQPVEDFVDYVEDLIPDKSTPIYTLCRTGVRSVGAAEALTKAGYTTVRNIWEGFVGIYLTAPFQDSSQSDPTPAPVDLNHDGELTDEDKNGWRYHQKLPYVTYMRPHLMYKGDYAETYFWD
jgi:rhodanese-related sulfurtransferase